MYPTKEEALILLKEAKKLNPGPWVEHALNAGLAAELIAGAHPKLNSEKAFVLGCLHDIGRYEGRRELHHVIAGYHYLNSKGYEEAARICMTHSFLIKDINVYQGSFDCTEEELQFIRRYLNDVTYDQYDRLIQLCDYLSLPTGYCILEKRMVDVALRLGVNELTLEKWKKAFTIKENFESEIGQSIYNLLPNIEKTID